MKQKPKGLIYALSTRGLGHITRGLWLAKVLLQHYQIDFIDGGLKPPIKVSSNDFQFLTIPRVYLEQSGKKYFCNFLFEESPRFLEKVIEQRIQALAPMLRDPYHFFIIESIPFLKFECKPEISFTIKKLKSLNQNCKIICLLDPHHLMFFFRKTPKIRSEILSFIKEHIDFIFCNSDPKVDPLAKKATKLLNLASKFYYTGYICDPDTPTTSSKNKRKRIIIYLGKHRDKIESYQTLARTAKYFPDYEFHAYESPDFLKTIDDSCRNKIQMPKNFFFKRFSEDWGKSISECKLLITTGKSAINTAIRTNTPTLVVYLQKYPQIERYKAFDHTGLLSPLYPQDFSPETIEEKINAALKISPPDRIDIDMNGAENTLKLIQKLC